MEERGGGGGGTERRGGGGGGGLRGFFKREGDPSTQLRSKSSILVGVSFVGFASAFGALESLMSIPIGRSAITAPVLCTGVDRT